MTQQLTSSPQKKLLDEGSFQELLAAAYVLQQHSERADDPSARSIEVLTEVVRIQRSIRSGKLNLVATANLIAEQLQKFTRADGVAMGIVSDNELVYLAAIGTAAQDIGRRVPRDSSLSGECIRTGLTVQFVTPHADDEDVKSFIAVPVEYERRVVAVLEARFGTVSAFEPEDVRTCELMAPLVRDVIARAGRRGANKEKRSADPHQQNGLFPEPVAVAENESIALQASADVIEAPSVAPLAVLSTQSEVVPPPVENEPGKDLEGGEEASPEVGVCRGCGEPLADDEAFCGKCGTETMIKPDGPLQSKWASMWFMNQARRTKTEDEPSESQPLARRRETPKLLPAELEELPQGETTAVEPAKPSLSLEWLPQAASSPRMAWLQNQWRVNRANFYVAGAAALLIAALAAPAIEPRTKANSSAPQLTLFERMLVGLGIAEAPQTPVSAGNPDIPVWVDLHTALYYCPGADLYGKTEGGKIATQRSAQLDQFEPAHRKPCN